MEVGCPLPYDGDAEQKSGTSPEAEARRATRIRGWISAWWTVGRALTLTRRTHACAGRRRGGARRLEGVDPRGSDPSPARDNRTKATGSDLGLKVRYCSTFVGL